jgi:hypothetical protein
VEKGQSDSVVIDRWGLGFLRPWDGQLPRIAMSGYWGATAVAVAKVGVSKTQRRHGSFLLDDLIGGVRDFETERLCPFILKVSSSFVDSTMSPSNI